MKESDMYEPLRELLLNKVACDAVYAEVALKDVVAIKGELAIVVEMKKQLSFKVIEQAIKAKWCADYIFVAVPLPAQPHSRLALDLLKREGIGLIYVTSEPSIHNSRENGSEIKFWGRRVRTKSYDIKESIDPSFHSRTVAGVKSGDGISEYSEMIDTVKRYLGRRDWVNIDDLVGIIQGYYSNPKPSLIRTLRADWNAHWIEFKSENRNVYCRLKRAVVASVND